MAGILKGKPTIYNCTYFKKIKVVLYFKNSRLTASAIFLYAASLG